MVSITVLETLTFTLAPFLHAKPSCLHYVLSEKWPVVYYGVFFTDKHFLSLFFFLLLEK